MIKAISTIILFTFLISCKHNEMSNQYSDYRLYYISNGESCESCLQAKYVAKRISKKLSNYFGNNGLIILNNSIETPDSIISNCKLFSGMIMVTKSKNGKIISFRKFDTNELVMYPKNPNPFIDKVTGKISIFVESKGKK